MKPKSFRSLCGSQSTPLLALVAITLSAGNALAATYQWDGGAASGSWSSGNNWNPDIATPFPTGFPVFNNAPAGQAHRLNVNGATPLEYTAAEGSTLYSNNVGTVRGLVIGSGTAGSGTMVISGGTFSTAGSTEKDIIGNSTGNTGTLTVSGGNFIGTSVGTTMGNGTSGNGVLNISNTGNATVATLIFGGANATVNLDGGTLSLNKFSILSGASNAINLNGGTLKARESSTTFLDDPSSNTSVFVKSSGAVIDTDGFDITISDPLLTHAVSTGGGITKNGLGNLTLSAVSTTTGPAAVNAGGLALKAGTASWTPSTLSHSGDLLDFNFGTYNAANPVPVITGDVTINNPVTVNITGSGFPVSGQIILLDYDNKFGTGTLVTGTMPAGLETATIEQNTLAGYYYLNIPLPAGTDFVWSKGTGDWDDTSFNWNGNSVAYAEPALVTFPDLSGGGTVTLTDVRSPLVVTINNQTGNDYTFDGSALSGGATLTKEGTGAATFSNDLALTGVFAINGGRIELTGSTPLATSGAAIATGAVLGYNNSSNVTQGSISFTGAGTVEKKGSNNLGTSNVTWGLGAGALIDVQGGTFQGGNGSDNNVWSGNLASLDIETGATFDGVEANVRIDALTGAGTYQGGNFGPRTLTVGAGNTDGTFTGTIQPKPGNPLHAVALAKVGTGTQTMEGPLTINTQTTYGTTALEVTGGTLNLNPSGGSGIGAFNNSVYVAPGQGQVATLNHSSGTITTGNFSIGNQGTANYNIFAGTVNASKIDLAFTGPITGSAPVSMSINGSSTQVNVVNGGILLGQYYGRLVTITQTDGEVVCYSDLGVTRGGTSGLEFLSGNTDSAYNLEGGTLSIPAITRAASGGGFGGGNGTLNFNGGILQVTSSSFSVPTGTANSKPIISLRVLGDNLTPDSGAIIDNYGLAVNFAAGFLHAGTSTFDGGLKVETSIPGGSVTLSGINTYTGNTTVSANNTLILANGAGLTFALDGDASNKVTGAGTVTFNGQFTIDTAFADLTNGNSWTLVDTAIPSGTFSSSFTLAGFSEVGTSGVHTMFDGTNTWTFNEGTGVLSIQSAVTSGYAAWIDDFTVADATATGDSDNDGIKNVLEYVLDGNPSIPDTSKLPSLSTTATDFVFSFTRREESAADTTQIFQYGSDLAGWTPVNITAPTDGSKVVLGSPSLGVQLVTVTIPKTSAVGGKLFGRLKASLP